MWVASSVKNFTGDTLISMVEFIDVSGRIC